MRHLIDVSFNDVKMPDERPYRHMAVGR